MCRSAYWPHLLLAAALFFALASPVLAQQREMDQLAAEFANKLKQPKWAMTGEVKAVVVAFQGPKGENSQLGTELADALIVALRRQGIILVLVDRSTLSRYRRKDLWPANEPWDPTVALNMANESGAKLYIFGNYGKGKDRVTLEVKATLLPDEKEIARVRSIIPLSEQWQKLAALPIASPPARPSPDASPLGVPRQTINLPGKDAVSPPECLRCVDPVYTREARDAHYTATVLLLITVTPKGNVGDIHILRGAEHGLSEQAKKAVAKWKFTPARTKAGVAIPAEVQVEIKFRIT